MDKRDFFHLFLLLIFWLIFFRKLFFGGLFPVPGNLLVWFFSPWKEEQWPQYPGGVYKQGLFGFDTIRQIYPWRSFSTDQLPKLQWPLWNPYQFSGAPHLANFQTAVFYPPDILYLLLPQIYAWTVLFISQPLLAGIFMYFFTRKIGISKLGSFSSAFFYAFSLPMSVWLIWNIHGHQFMYLPLVLYLIERYKEKEKNTDLFYLIAVLSLTFLAGHPQIFIFILIFCSFYFLYRVKKIKQWLFIFFAVIGLTAASWLPLAEYYNFASREIKSSEFSFTKTLLPWKNLITLLAPDFLGNPTTDNYWGRHDYTESAMYAGILALVFALLAVFSKNKYRKFFMVTILIVFSLCLNWFLPRILLWLKVPIFTTSPATRVLFLASFSLCVLAGFGVDEFLKLKRIPRIIFLPGLFFMGIFGWLILAPKFLTYQTWFEYLKVMKRNLVLPLVIYFLALLVLVLTLKLNKIKTKLFYLLFPLAALDLFYVAHKVTPFTYKELIFPTHPLIAFLQKNSGYYRFAGSEASNIESNFATFYRLFSTEGYDTLYPRYYGELVWAGDNGVYKEDISRTTVVFPTVRSDAKYRLEDLLGVKYVLEKDDNYKSEWDANYALFPQERYQLVWQKKNWKVYENLKVLPRAFLSGSFMVIPNKKEAIETIYNQGFNPIKTIILEKEPSSDFKFDSTPGGKADIISYQPNKIELVTQASGNKILFLSDTYYPGWKAYVDGKKAEIYKANGALRAVFIPAGIHKVIFSYEPASFKIGLLTSFVFLFGTIIIYLKICH